MRQTVIGDVSGSVLGMLEDLCGKLRCGSLTPRELELFLQRRNPFVGITALLEEWQKFYRDRFGLDKDFSELTIPEQRRGFDRLLIIAEGMMPNRLYDKCAELFPCYRYIDDLDSITSVRRADHDYAIWVRDRIEADDELKNKSALDLEQDLEQAGIVTLTIEERFVYELKQFDETDGHLDRENVTLCADSRDSRGDVPRVHWFDDELQVFWSPPRDADSDLRARAAVS